MFTGPIGEFYLVTEFIEGDQYDHAKWVLLPEDERTKICSKIVEQYRLLRSVPGEGYYGRVHNQGWRGLQRLFRLYGRKPRGPYNTYNEFVSAILETIELQTALSALDEGAWDPPEAAFLSEARRFLATCPRGHEPKLTHLDPAMRNILIRKVVQDDGAEDWEVTFIDWLRWMVSCVDPKRSASTTNGPGY